MNRIILVVLLLCSQAFGLSAAFYTPPQIAIGSDAVLRLKLYESPISTLPGSSQIFDYSLNSNSGALKGTNLFVASWRQVAPQVTGTSSVFGLAELDGKLYGGTAGSGKLLEWNGSDTWVEVAPQLDSDTNIRCIATFNDKIYGGTWPTGRLLEWNGTDAWVAVAEGTWEQIGILSLTVHDSKLYGGTANNSLLFEWNGSNAWIKKANQPTGDTSIRSLCSFGGNLYGGSGNTGKLHEWNGTNAWVEKAAKSGSETAIKDLIEFNSKLYAGTSPNGLLLEWNDINAWAGKATQFESEDGMQLAVLNDGLYGGTRTKGKLLKWNGTNAWTEAAAGLGKEVQVRSLITFGTIFGGTNPGGNLQKFRGSANAKFPGYQFNGTDDYIDTGSTFQTTFRDSFSISMWVKPDDGQPAAGNVCLGSLNAAGQDGTLVTIRTTGVIRFRVESNNVNTLADTSSAVFTDGQQGWTHILVTAEADTQLRIYFNGSEQTLDGTNDGDASGATFADWTSTENIFVGARSQNAAASLFCGGLIDEVAIWNKLLTAEEVRSIYETTRWRYGV